jgi:predicted dehydrogenase
VAEPIKEFREYIKQTHNLPDERCFDTYETLLALPKMADVAVITTSDSLHYQPAMMALNLGYDLFLEKPVAPTPEECADIANLAKEKGAKVLVCHVLRYTLFYSKVKDIITSGKIGKVISVHHNECVGNVHQSHSYVRGNWHNTAESSCMLLAKSCHDIDLIQWLVDSKCTKVQSFGSLTYFTKENAPEDAPDYCIDGCPHGEECCYNAVKLYLEAKKNYWFRDAAAGKVKATDAEVEEALRTTQYGKCVFKCNNDVVDHQVVNMEFENGAVASFNMCAFNKGGRFTRIMGTAGELWCDIQNNVISLYDFKTKTTEKVDINNGTDSILDGHAGGDTGIVDATYKYMAEGITDEFLSEIDISVENHLTVFAAEKSRLEGTVVDVFSYKDKYII